MAIIKLNSGQHDDIKNKMRSIIYKFYDYKGSEYNFLKTWYFFSAL